MARVWTAVRRHQRGGPGRGRRPAGRGRGAARHRRLDRPRLGHPAAPAVRAGGLSAWRCTSAWRCRAWGRWARCAGSGDSSPACGPRCSCCSCWPSRPCPDRCCRRPAMTRPRSRRYLQDHQTLGPAARSPRCLRRLQLGVVLGDLPAALRLPRRLRRAAEHQTARALREPPPRTPRRPERLPESAVDEAEPCRTIDPERAAAAVADVLRRKRYRVQVQEDGARRRGGVRALARGRQPGLPPVPRRAAPGRRGRAPLGLARRRDRAGRELGRRHRRASTTRVDSSAPGSTARSCRTSRSGSTRCT